jgi:hypothetical protein
MIPFSLSQKYDPLLSSLGSMISSNTSKRFTRSQAESVLEFEQQRPTCTPVEVVLGLDHKV